MFHIFHVFHRRWVAYRTTPTSTGLFILCWLSVLTKGLVCLFFPMKIRTFIRNDRLLCRQTCKEHACAHIVCLTSHDVMTSLDSEAARVRRHCSTVPAGCDQLHNNINRLSHANRHSARDDVSTNSTTVWFFGRVWKLGDISVQSFTIDITNTTMF